ncbi:hypothetical protein T484DRAFT_1800513, partial [Baffinella frigidus]
RKREKSSLTPGVWLREYYEDVFRTEKDREGSTTGTLEQHLCEFVVEGKYVVLDMIAAQRDGMRQRLDKKLLSDAKAGAGGASSDFDASKRGMKRLFERPAAHSCRVESVRKVLKDVCGAAKGLAEEARRPNGSVYSGMAQRKSFTLDILLRLSECPRVQYRTGQGCKQAELEATRYVAAKHDERARMMGGTGDDAAEQVPFASNVFVLPNIARKLCEDTRFWPLGEDPVSSDDDAEAMQATAQKTKTPKEIETQIEQDSEKFCVEGKRPVSEDYRPFGVPFVMPVGNTRGSTTAVSIAIRYAQTYQVVLDYYSEEEMKDEYWAPACEELEIRPKPAFLRMVREEVQLAMGGREKDDVGSGRVVSEEEAEAFLREPDLAVVPELRSVLGQSFAFVGRGFDPRFDRICMRRLLYVAQGMEDTSFGDQVPEEAPPVGGCSRPPLSRESTGGSVGSAAGAGPASGPQPIKEAFNSFDHGKQLAFGRKTKSALKRITLWVPCGIAPALDGQWMDTAGSRDRGKRQEGVLRQELASPHSEQIAVVVQKGLTTAGAASEAKSVGGLLMQTFAMKHLLGFEAGTEDEESLAAGIPQIQDTSIFVLHNREQISNLPLLTLKDVKADERPGGRLRREKDSAGVMQSLIEDCSEGLAEIDPAPDVAKLAEKVPMLSPALKLFVSHTMRVSPADEAPQQGDKDREKILELSGVYELLGVCENFLQRGIQGHVRAVLEFLGDDGDSRGLIGSLSKLEGQDPQDQETLWDDFSVEWKGHQKKLQAQVHESLRGLISDLSPLDKKSLKSEILKKCSPEAYAKSAVDVDPAQYLNALEASCHKFAGKWANSVKTRLRTGFKLQLVKIFQAFVAERVGDKMADGDDEKMEEKMREIKTMIEKHVGDRFGKLSRVNFLTTVGNHFERRLKFWFQRDVR